MECSGLHKGRGHLIVSDGQKGGRAWKIPEQGGWYGGGRGREGCTCDNEGRQRTGQSAGNGLVTNQNDLPVTLTCTRHVSVLPEGSAASILIV